MTTPNKPPTWPQRYQKKPVIIDAIQFMSDNIQTVVKFLNDAGQKEVTFNIQDGHGSLEVQTEEGPLTARVGSYIIKGIEGEVYPCRADIFHKTYIPVGEEEL